MSTLINSLQSTAWGDRSPVAQLGEHDQRLGEACRNGDVQLAQTAIAQGADINVHFRLALGEISPIFLCAKYGNVKVAQVLIENRVNLNKRIDFDGTTCLHHAVANNQYEMVDLLVHQQLSVNAVDKLNRTPLMDAAEMGNEKIVKYLIDNQADATLKDKEGHSALSYCLDFIKPSQPQFEKCAVYLIENGADARSAGKFSNSTLLHYAASTGNLDLCKKLVEEYKVAVLIYDGDGKTPVILAKQNHHDNVVNYLMEHLQQPKTCTIL